MTLAEQRHRATVPLRRKTALCTTANALLVVLALWSCPATAAGADAGPGTAVADGSVADAATDAPAPSVETAAGGGGTASVAAGGGGMASVDAGGDAAWDAPAPQDEPSGAAQAALSPTAVAFAAELDRAEGVRREQVKFRNELQAEQTTPAESERRARFAELADEAQKIPAQSDAAGTLLQRVMAELASLRPDVETAFRNAASPPEVPRYTPFAGVVPPQDLPDADRQKLDALHRSLSDDATALELETTRSRSEHLTRLLDDEAQLDGVRVLLLNRLSADKRDETLGMDRPGMDQLRWELWHIGMRVRWYGLRRSSAGQDVREMLRDPFDLAAYGMRSALLLAAVVAVLYLSRRRQRWIDAARTALSRFIVRPRMLRTLDHVHGVVSVLSGELIFLGAIWGVHWALGPAAGRVREVDLAYSLLLWYALYRIVLTALHRYIEWRSATPGPRLSEATSHKVLRSLRTIGRYALTIGFILTLSEITVGKGYLYHAVVRLAWLGTILLVWILIRRWRGDICDAYLRQHDTGPLADAVRGTRNRWNGFFVAVIAFSVLALAMAGDATRRFVLSFEQSHRVLAFMFRRRLERRAEPDPPDALAGLPGDLLAHLPEKPLADDAHALDHFPGLDRFETLLGTWKDSRRVGALLLVGGAGSGKTTWLQAAERKAAGLPSVRIALNKRLLTAEDVVTTLGTALDAPPEARTGPKALASWLRSLPRRLCVLDDLEHLFLRGLDTWRAWDAFLEIVEYSAPGVFWLCALAHHPYRYLLFARGGATVFRAIVQLPRWSEQKLTELCCARTRASGYTLSFQDLVVGDGDNDQETGELGTERDFTRLLWDYSQGCPRVALHYWLRSLAVAGDRHLRVRLFSTPKDDELEALNELERFVLASVVWHDSLTAQEAAWSLGFPKLPCEDALAKLVEHSIIDDHGGRHRVTTQWQCAVMSFLVRKHLIQP